MRMFILLKTDYTFSLTDHRHKSTAYILFAIYNLIQQQDILCRTIFSRPHWPISYIILYECNFFPPTSKFRQTAPSNVHPPGRFELVSNFPRFFSPIPLPSLSLSLSISFVHESNTSTFRSLIHLSNEWIFIFFSLTKKQDWKGNAFFIKSKIWNLNFSKTSRCLLTYDQIILRWSKRSKFDREGW